MSIADLLTAAAIGMGGLGGAGALIQAIFTRSGARSQAAKTGTEDRAIQHKTWFDEAQAAYKLAREQCTDCLNELKAEKVDHAKELAGMRRDLAEVRRALILRADVVDELLPYVQGLPDDKMLELRATNRAVKMAAYRVDFNT